MLRLLSFALLLATWWIAAAVAGSVKLPPPSAVLAVAIAESQSGALFLHLGATLARVTLAFTLSMAIGSALGYWMGRSRLANRLGDPWLILLLNLPALVVIVLAYIWAGLTEVAAIAAIAINKLPTAVVTLREGSGLSLVWKIVLVAELLGRPNGIGFEIGVAFQLFDIPLLLAYSLSFAAVVLVIEAVIVQPVERRASRWRLRAA